MVLVIPVTLLKDSFYDPSLPNNFNYATLGKIIANKIFDHIFEPRNNITVIDEETHNSNTWWISDGFESAINCLIREFSDFRGLEVSV